MSVNLKRLNELFSVPILGLGTLALCSLILAAPLLDSSGNHGLASAIYAGFSPVCHQLQGRSFELLGRPWAVCQRCSGIYFGLLIGAMLSNLAFSRLASAAHRRNWVLVASAPLALDVGLQALGIWSDRPFSRAFTGLLFGTMVGSLLARALGEILSETHSHRLSSNLDGGIT